MGEPLHGSHVLISFLNMTIEHGLDIPLRSGLKQKSLQHASFLCHTSSFGPSIDIDSVCDCSNLKYNACVYVFVHHLCTILFVYVLVVLESTILNTVVNLLYLSCDTIMHSHDCFTLFLDSEASVSWLIGIGLLDESAERAYSLELKT